MKGVQGLDDSEGVHLAISPPFDTASLWLATQGPGRWSQSAGTPVAVRQGPCKAAQRKNEQLRGIINFA